MVKRVSEIPTNQIQQHTENTVHHDHIGFIPGI